MWIRKIIYFCPQSWKMKFHVRILKIRLNWISNFPSRLLFFIFHRRKWLANILKAHDDKEKEEDDEENVVIVEARSDWHKFQFVATNSLFHGMLGVREREGWVSMKEATTLAQVKLIYEYWEKQIEEMRKSWERDDDMHDWRSTRKKE